MAVRAPENQNIEIKNRITNLKTKMYCTHITFFSNWSVKEGGVTYRKPAIHITKKDIHRLVIIFALCKKV